MYQCINTCKGGKHTSFVNILQLTARQWEKKLLTNNFLSHICFQVLVLKEKKKVGKPKKQITDNFYILKSLK